MPAGELSSRNASVSAPTQFHSFDADGGIELCVPCLRARLREPPLTLPCPSRARRSSPANVLIASFAFIGIVILFHVLGKLTGK